MYIWFMRFLILVLVFISISCRKDKDGCEDLSCGEGFCDNGTCICNNWYEGSICSKRATRKFEGTYFARDGGCGSPSPILFTVTQHDDVINGLWIIKEINLYAKLTSNTEFNIPVQVIKNNEIKGSGELIGDSLHLNYTFFDGSNTYNCDIIAGPF